ncbi:aspartate aminotransferase family protein [Gemmatimonadota bacterium]
MNDNARLLDRLSRLYLEAYPHAGRELTRSADSLIHGGSHSLRLFSPAPFRAIKSRGATVIDGDGQEILDFWQGHYANILGHNPPVVTEALIKGLDNGYGLQSGIVDSLQIDFAELLQKQTGAERFRFTTSGALANQYAIMLARAFTGRSLILKIGGGWQGAQALTFKGVSFLDGYDHPETEGLSQDMMDRVLLARYNDPENLEDLFRQHGDQIACFILEPWMGMGGFMPPSAEYLHLARELTQRYGAMLILDEIISGFRFRAGGVHTLYGIEPELSTYAKIVGGGMPLAVVAGREEIMRLCGPEGGRRVKFDGGTFSAHPASLLAGYTTVNHLAANEDDIYPRLGMMGEKMRKGVEAAFARGGISVICTGYGNEIVPGSSVAMVHFPIDEDLKIISPEQVWDPNVCDVERREQVLKLAMLLGRVHVMHGLGALSTEHTDEHLEWLFEACETAAAHLRS